jgi:hypothetical protein
VDILDHINGIPRAKCNIKITMDSFLLSATNLSKKLILGKRSLFYIGSHFLKLALFTSLKD